MSSLFNRDYSLSVFIPGERFEIRDLRIVFSIQKSIGSDPNQGTITIHNLAEKTRAKLKKAQTIILNAGYIDNIQTIYSAQVTNVTPKKDATDITVELTCADGVDFIKATASKSYAESTGEKSIILDLFSLARRAGVDFILEGTDFIVDEPVRNGFVIHGLIYDTIKQLLENQGLEFSVQDGRVKIIKGGGFTTSEKIVLNKNSGLIGRPEKLEEGNIKFEALLNGKIFPTQVVEIQSETNDEVNGDAVVEKLTYVGDTRGEDWHLRDVEARPLVS